MGDEVVIHKQLELKAAEGGLTVEGELGRSLVTCDFDEGVVLNIPWILFEKVPN